MWKKCAKYAGLLGRYYFCPLAFETFGTWGEQAKELITDIGKRIADQTGERRSVEFLRQKISIEIQRGNAASVFGTLPSSRGLDQIFYVLDAKTLDVC